MDIAAIITNLFVKNGMIFAFMLLGVIMFVAYKLGSLTKGRCGANSDLDVLVDVSKKPGDDTPPPAVSLTCEAPCISCSRARTRTSSGLSATMAPPITSMRVSMPPIVRGRSVSCRKSPCPLVIVIMAPDG